MEDKGLTIEALSLQYLIIKSHKGVNEIIFLASTK